MRRVGHWTGRLEDNLPLAGWVVRHYLSLDAEDDPSAYPLCDMYLFQRPRHRFVMHHEDTGRWADVGCECCVHMFEGDRSFARGLLTEMRARARRVDALAELFRPANDPLWDDVSRWVDEGIAFEVYRVDGSWTASARHPVHDYVLWRRGGHRSQFDALAAVRDECLTPRGLKPQDWLCRRMEGRTAKKGLPKLRADGRTLIVVEDGNRFRLLQARKHGGWLALGGGLKSPGHALRRAATSLGWTRSCPTGPETRSNSSLEAGV